MKLLDAFSLLAVEFADREAIALDMVNHAGRDGRRRRINQAADDAVGIDLPGQDARGIETFQPVIVVLAAEPLEVPPRQAVLNGQHDGVGTEHRIDIPHHLIEEMRLHRQHDDVLLAGLGRLVDGLHFGGVHLAVMPLELEAVFLDRREVCALVDDGDVLARERKLGRQQAADGARADHADLFLLGRRAQQVRARQHLVENIAEAADAIDHDLDDVMGVSHGAGAERGAAGDDVARHQRHVLGNRGDEFVRREKHVGDRIVLPLLAVQDGLDRQLHWIDAGRDHRSEHAKCVEALGARPLLERFVLAQEIDGGDVVHAGIAEDIFAGLGLRDVEAFLADDDAELALVNDLSGVGGRPLDRPVRGPIGIRGFEEPERFFRLLELVLGGELVEIIPQADHLRRIARR